MRFSIIMPVYNAGGFLCGAVDSVLNQSFRDFELILIDDGSSDGSTEICRAYAKDDDRIVFTRQQNLGICHARNVGLKLACGEYIGFCDHDDEYLPGCLAAVVGVIEQQKRVYDIIKVRHETFSRKLNGSVRFICGHTPFDAGEWHRESYHDTEFRNYISTVWDGFYRRDFVQEHQLSFDESFRFGGEDMLFNLHALDVAGSAWYCGKTTYYKHYENEGKSTSSKSHVELISDYFKVIEYQMTHFPVAEKDAYKRFTYWESYFFKYVFDAQGSRVGYVKSSRITAKLSKRLLPVTGIGCPLKVRIFVVFRQNLLLGMVLRLHAIMLKRMGK